MTGAAIIRRYKAFLIVAVAASVLLFTAELLYLQRIGTFRPTPATGLAVLLPPLSVFVFGYPLFYLSWLGSNTLRSNRIPRLLFFWTMVVVSALAFAQAASYLVWQNEA